MFCIVNGEYFKVVSESCEQLANSTALFDSFLLPCGVYRADNTEMRCLSSSEVTAALKTVSDWTYLPNSEAGDAIKRTFAFADFQSAFLFMSKSAQLAEKNQHHPDWRNLWNTVEVTLTTDDKLCLSTFDIELAQGMDLLFKN